ncbi:MAG: hypothetical protein CL811_06545 [Colwelliaceae bacterium]|jgi:hypothetical protein|nr:hypothetical protein [Colwelliaceae bacterium]|tara:strand:- start:1100 stop:1681 length:582 start_codon:yes stop_codon:yes gene_type:complete
MIIDEMTKIIQQREKSIALSFFDIGKDLIYIRDKKLYLKNYKTFKDYIEDNFKFSKRSAEKYMAVTTRFQSRNEAASLGIEKLYILTQIQEEKSFELLEEAQETHIPRDKLIQRVNRMKSQAGEPPRYSDDRDEHDLKLIRQFQSLEIQFEEWSKVGENLSIALQNWKNEAVQTASPDVQKLIKKTLEMIGVI